MALPNKFMITLPTLFEHYSQDDRRRVQSDNRRVQDDILASVILSGAKNLVPPCHLLPAENDPQPADEKRNPRLENLVG